MINKHITEGELCLIRKQLTFRKHILKLRYSGIWFNLIRMLNNYDLCHDFVDIELQKEVVSVSACPSHMQSDWKGLAAQS